MKTRLIPFCVVPFVVLLVMGGPQAQEQPGDAAAAALLDDPTARGKMSAMLEVKLLMLDGRMDELGGGMAGASQGLATPLSTNDVLVNDPGSDVGLSTTQSETSIRVNAVTGTICSAYNDSQHYAVGATAFSGFSRSTDGGASFVDRGAIPPGGGGNSFGDPSLVWRQADGDFYYASLHSDGLGLWRSEDDCETFAFHSMIHTGYGDDKELMAVDNDPSSSHYGRFYVAWTDFDAGARIYSTYSDDGLTWSSPVALSDSYADVQGAWPAVAPNGDVYVCWVRWNPYYFGPIDIECVRSVNGGASFSSVSNPMTGRVNPMDPSATSACYRPALNADIRYLPSPQIEVGPDGCLHVVYSYDPDGYAVGDTVNVYYRRSCNNGTSWGTEVQLNDDGTMTDQWFPTVSVGETNRVVATWYDRRLDPGSNHLFDYYLRTSEDGGTTWAPSTRLTDVSSAVPSLNPNFDPIVATCYHGDYDQQVQDAASVYVQWSDDRNIQNGHPDPDVWFEKVFFCDAGVGTLEGTVTASSGGAPIEGAEVSANGVTGHTDSSGFYQVTLCAGTYDVTASAFGYLSETQYGVAVVDGAVTVADFALDTAPGWTLSGTVTDSTTGWPLYAEVNFGPGSVWTDPETGEYSVDLPEGAYGLEASAWIDGYLLSTAAVNLVSNTTRDFALDADTALCTAPGYDLSTIYSDDFESGAPGWTATGLWHLADASACGDSPPDSPPTAFYYGVDGACNFDVGSNAGQITSPIISGIDVSSTLSFNHWREVEEYSGCYDHTWVEIVTTGGTTTVWELCSSDPSTATWEGVGPISLAAFAGQSIRVRFNFSTGDSIANDFTGWFIDDVQIGGLCTPPVDGGLVAGNVRDENVGDGIVGAMVSVDVGGSTTTGATPGDPDLDEGFYTLYVPTGTHDLTASDGDAYGTDTQTVEVVDLGTVGQDFELPAGLLSSVPDRVDAIVCPDDLLAVPVKLINAGGLDAGFELVEREECINTLISPPVPTGPFADPTPLVPSRRIRKEEWQALSTEALGPLPDPPAAPTLDAGDVIQSWPAPANGDPWGIAYTFDASVWVGEGWGANEIFEYQPDGTPTGNSWPYTWGPVYGPADQAFNWNTGMVWSLDVGGDDCLHEMDPASGYTGNTICGPWGISQRGVAYDPASDTWFAGGWNEGIVYHIDSAGVLLDSAFVGLTIAGLAYNPDTQHLFVIPNFSPNDAIYVLDASDNYNLVGQFYIPFGPYGAAGLEIDCDGNLWAVEQQTDTVYQLESGETAHSLCHTDVPWLSLAPTSGTIPAQDEEEVTFTFDATGLEVETFHEACVQVDNDTPYGSLNIPVAMEVSCETLFVSYGVEGGLPHSETLNGTPVRPVDAVDVSNGELVFAAFPDVILEDIDAFHVMPDGSVVFSTSTDVSQGFGGLSAFKNGDLIMWDGIAASLLFSEVVGFGSSLNNIDAFSVLPNGNWLLSTDLPAILGGLSFQNGDIVEYDPVADVGTLYMGLDEATIFTGTPQSNADIDALQVDKDGSVIFSIRSNGIGRIGNDLPYGWADAASTDLFLLDPASGHAEFYLDAAGLFDGVTRNLDAVSLDAGAIPVPEPGRWLLLGFGIAGLLVIGRRRILA